ncbi:MAG: hypothetical protein ABSA78_12320 [Candidatus Sulfotelmatobacter sp.]|jgi:hypothetical protein
MNWRENSGNLLIAQAIQVLSCRLEGRITADRLLQSMTGVVLTTSFFEHIAFEASYQAVLAVLIFNDSQTAAILEKG